MAEEAVLGVGIKYHRRENIGVMMFGGAGKGGQFFVGAISGLALAVLLVGAASFLPSGGQHNGALQADTNRQQQRQEFAGAAGAASSSTSTTTEYTPAAQSAVGAPSIAHTATPVGGGGAASASGGQAKAGLAVNSSATASSSSSSNQDNGPAPAGVGASGSVVPVQTQQQQSAPNSLLVSLPQEGAGNLLATFSPLLVGLIVALLIYGAFTRRQDSSS
jgi:hypothetical protein